MGVIATKGATLRQFPHLERARAGVLDVADHLRTSWWPVPSACVVAAIGLSFAVERIDDLVSNDVTAWYLFKGGPEAAREVLSTVASSMMTFTGLVFSVTMVVLQLASSQFSPRVIRTFLKDRPSQLSLGTFVGTFVFALLGLRKARGAGDGFELHVPSFTVWLSVILSLGCVVAFVGFIHHTAQSIRAEVVIRRIGAETRASIERLYPDGIGVAIDEEPCRSAEAPVTLVIPNDGPSGVLAKVDVESLVRSCGEGDAILHLLPRLGDFVPYGAPLFEVRGASDTVNIARASAAVRLRGDHDVQQGASFGIRELVDIAERALSPGINDSSTAVEVIHELHDILRRLATRRFPSSIRRAEDGHVVLILPHLTFDEFVALGVNEIRRAGKDAPQVLSPLRDLLIDVKRVAPPQRRAELDAQLALVNAALANATP